MDIQYPSENSQKKQRILIVSVSIVVISLGAIWFFSFKNTVQEMFKDEQPDESGLIDTIKTDFDTIIDELQIQEEEIATSTEETEPIEIISEDDTPTSTEKIEITEEEKTDLDITTTTENTDILEDSELNETIQTKKTTTSTI